MEENDFDDAPQPTNQQTHKNTASHSADADNASTTANKKTRQKATGRKSNGKRRGKPIAARK